MSASSPDAAILRHLTACTACAAAEVGTALRMAPAEVRARLAYGVRAVPAFDRWSATARDFPDVAVEGARREVHAVRGAGRQLAAAATYYVQHGMALPRPSRVEPDEWRIVLRVEGACAAVARAEMPAEAFA